MDIVSPLEFNYVNGNTDPDEECVRLGKLISKHPIDVAFVGIGENSQLAFNDPPADFETEEACVLALVAPRTIKMCNHKKDDIPAFLPSEMLRSYNSAKPVFKMYGVENNITYQLFDLPHGYMSEDREALLGWFDLHLKGIGKGASRKETPFKQLPEEKLMVFPKGQRDADGVSFALFPDRSFGLGVPLLANGLRS